MTDLNKVKEALEFYADKNNDATDWFDTDIEAMAAEALTELNTFIESNGWQDIETYDREKHDNCVLVHDRLPIPARYDSDTGKWMFGGAFLDNPDIFIAVTVKPTHWQPLPSIKSIKV